MRFQAPRGTEDVLPNASHRWLELEQTFRRCVGARGYREVRTPTFEDAQLFLRTAGESSDIVTKQMYDFVDKGGRHITLKPEGTAPVLRALIEGGSLAPGVVQRVSYVTPIFRYERPQKGRLREAHQVGFELIGSESMRADAEVIETTVRFYEQIGLAGLVVKLNSLGRQDCRQAYRSAILDFAADYLRGLEDADRDRIVKNPLRLLDSKDPHVIELMRGAPSILDYLEPESKARFEQLQTYLKAADIVFAVSPEIVRGLDYYTETVFEVHSERIGAQSALCGGGRYDGLIRELGGPDLPAVGVAMGVERALLALESEGMAGEPPTIDAYVVAASPEWTDVAFSTYRSLLAAGCSALIDLDGRSMKAQLRSADREGCRFAVIIGDDEGAKGWVSLKPLIGDGEQTMMALEDAIQAMRGPGA